MRAENLQQLQEINAEKQELMNVIRLRNNYGYLSVIESIKQKLKSSIENLKNADTQNLPARHAEWKLLTELFQYLSTVSDVAEQEYLTQFGVDPIVDFI
jgi:altronate dehydratase